MNKVFIFTLGAAIGSLLTWKLIEKKYKDLADEEIEAVREYYKGKEDIKKKLDNHIDRSESGVNDTDEVKIDYDDIINDLGYFADDSITIEKDGSVYIEPTQDKFEPYVISPEEYGDRVGYDTKSWTYYADFVLTDDNDEIVWDPERYLGDGLNHFGEYEDDAVHVRNENTKCDYEILKHDKTFTEIAKEAI